MDLATWAVTRIVEETEFGMAAIKVVQTKTHQGGGYKQTTNHLKSTINLIILDVKRPARDMHTLVLKMEMHAGAETQGPTISV